jgi:S1-C subfamily serine protease
MLRVLRPTAPQFALGLSLEPHAEGARVTAVTPEGTAEAMGVQAGDIIVELDGKPVSPRVVQEFVQKTKIGDQVILKIKRAGAVRELTGIAKPRPS